MTFLRGTGELKTAKRRLKTSALRLVVGSSVCSATSPCLLIRFLFTNQGLERNPDTQEIARLNRQRGELGDDVALAFLKHTQQLASQKAGRGGAEWIRMAWFEIRKIMLCCQGRGYQAPGRGQSLLMWQVSSVWLGWLAYVIRAPASTNNLRPQ